MRLLLLILILVAVVFILAGCLVAIFTWHRSRRNQLPGLDGPAGE